MHFPQPTRPNPKPRTFTKAQRIANGAFSASLHDKKGRYEEMRKMAWNTGLRVR